MSTIFRNRWIEVAMPSHSMGALTLSNYHEHESLQVGLFRFSMYFKLPKFLRGEVMEEAYGFYFGDDALVFEWNRKRKFFHYPWALDFHARYERVTSTKFGPDHAVTCWIKLEDMRDSLMREQKRRYLPHGEVATKETHPYTYTLRNGEVQKRNATIYAQRYEHRRRWLHFVDWFALKNDSIDIEFDEEVGERTGSWKGGCTGCSYQLLAGESNLDCLRRMEAERKF